jgi:hypothetical protein
MMEPDEGDREFEAYLRSFQPHQPRPLPGRGKLFVLRWRGPAIAVAAMAAVLVLTLLSMRHSLSSAPSPAAPVEMTRTADISIAEQVSLGRLSILAKQDPARLEAQLDQVSSKLLPDVRSGHGVLQALSAE